MCLCSLKNFYSFLKMVKIIFMVGYRKEWVTRVDKNWKNKGKDQILVLVD